ncbi:5960_t:CDS:1, partial [Ambispora gerdemannii]
MTWDNVLNDPNISDVKFTVGNQTFYAISKILATQSKYFEGLFKDYWLNQKKNLLLESSKESISVTNEANKNMRISTARIDDDKFLTQKIYNHEIEIQDTDPGAVFANAEIFLYR